MHTLFTQGFREEATQPPIADRRPDGELVFVRAFIAAEMGPSLYFLKVAVETENKCERLVSNVDQALRCCRAVAIPESDAKSTKMNFLQASPVHLRT